ncbi:MAG TPA: PIN domain-containing protein [Thermoleophilaceae bacterium]|nr:PIN domain-containing protein [Thermoleophilaceae bacterium]
MTLIVDAAPLVALADSSDRLHERVRSVLRSEPGQLVIPAPVTAEVDHLLGIRHGAIARRRFLADLAAGRFTVGCLEGEDYAAVAEIDLKYSDLDLGLADCSLIVMAHRHATDRVLSFDERHLRAVAPIGGGAFTILPADDQSGSGS